MNSKPKHTPGPWSVYEAVNAQAEIVSSTDNDFSVRVEGRTTDDAEANAQLIAAAPELLEAAVTVADKLEAWAETAERHLMNYPDYHPKRDTWRNESVNYRALISLLRDSINKAGGK